jgi:hypothetical protein
VVNEQRELGDVRDAAGLHVEIVEAAGNVRVAVAVERRLAVVHFREDFHVHSAETRFGSFFADFDFALLVRDQQVQLVEGVDQQGLRFAVRRC